MLKAIEAKKIADEFNLKKKAAADAVACDEWSAYLEPKIMEASRKGAYSIEYFWSKEVFADFRVSPENFAESLESFVTAFGYAINIFYTKGGGQIVRVDVTISWKEIKDE